MWDVNYGLKRGMQTMRRAGGGFFECYWEEKDLEENIFVLWPAASNPRFFIPFMGAEILEHDMWKEGGS